MAVDQQEFRQVMGHFATGVTVITTHDGKGNLFGLTANAVSSVSLDPPLVLCCIARSSESHAAFAASGVFSVHILSHAQEALSRRFAKSGEDKFVGVAFGTGASGCPILEGSLAHLECEIRHHFEEALRADAELMDRISDEELAGCFDLSRHLRHVDAIIDRALKGA